MLIIYGSKLYGKVDVVPGLFHVETKFGHLWYFPLIPLASYLVFQKSGDGFNGVMIPMSFKSVCYAWLRAGSLVAGIVASIIAATGFKKGENDWITPSIVGVSALATFVVLSFHRGSTHASYRRACQLGDMIGLTPEARQAIDQIYGSPDEQEPDSFLQESGRT